MARSATSCDATTIARFYWFVRISQPELADVFRRQLLEVMPALEVTEDEIKLTLFKKIIDNELTATFIYGSSSVQVAPAEIMLDENGCIEIRAFQIAPELGWKSFKLSSIRDLVPEGSRKK